MDYPNYLKKITKEIKNKRHKCFLNVVCQCGCDKFILKENLPTNDSNDYWYDIKSIYIKCKSCNKEFLLFDNRIHGYNSIQYQGNNLSNLNYSYSNEFYSEIKITLYQDVSFDEYKEDTSNLSYENYLNSYSYIKIIGKCNGKKKKVLVSEETA